MPNPLLSMRSLLTAAVAVASFGCAAQPPAQQPAQAHAQQHPQPHPQPHPQERAQGLGGPATRVVELPGTPGAGEPREARVLVDEPPLKLTTIVLRGGTVLPAHHAAVPVTIVALQGSGTVVSGSERLRLDPTHAVVLAPNVPHAVEPDAGTDLVLLVHHLGRGADHHP